jgi:hypothetical protein
LKANGTGISVHFRFIVLLKIQLALTFQIIMT